jgi:uncharacterized protein DUF6326
MGDRMRTTLSALWIFATLNYLYCDVVTLMDPNLLQGYIAGSIGGVAISPGFLVAAAVLVEVPMAMVILARFRWANVLAGTAMTLIQLATLFVRTPALYYAFFSAIEIATTAAVVLIAWRWRLALAG